MIAALTVVENGLKSGCSLVVKTVRVTFLASEVETETIPREPVGRGLPGQTQSCRSVVDAIGLRAKIVIAKETVVVMIVGRKRNANTGRESVLG